MNIKLIRIATLAALMFLTGCAGLPADPPVPPTTPTEVDIEVPVSCVDEVPDFPEDLKTDEEMESLGNYDFVTEAHVERLNLHDYAQLLHDLLQACK